MAKRKTLFDDRPIEISELTYVIRQDIAALNNQIASLQTYVRAHKSGKNAAGGGAGGNGQQVEEHNSNVVMLLQSRLANMGMGFKDVLELRTQVSTTTHGRERESSVDADMFGQNMKASKDRTEQFMHTTASSSVPPPSKGASGSLPLSFTILLLLQAPAALFLTMF